jgi:hypothetical protein
MGAQNVCHVIGRSRLGGIPCSFRIFAIVDRATRWPTFLSAPWIRVEPQVGLSVAHPDGETADFGLHAGSARPRPHVGPLPGNQLAVPPQDRVRRDDRRDVREDPSAETLPDDGEPATFVVAQPHAPAVQLRLELRGSLPAGIR